MPEPRMRVLQEESGPSRPARGRRGGALRLAKAALLLFAVLFALSAALGGRDSKPSGSSAGTGVPTSSAIGGPSEAYASTVNGVIGELQQAVRPEEQTLEQSSTWAGRAAAARALAGAYEDAASQLDALDLSPTDRDANERLVTALEGTGGAYRAAAQAAAAADASGYRSAGAAIPGAQEHLDAALSGVRAAGDQPASEDGTAPPQGEATPSPAPAPPADASPAPSRSSTPIPDVGDSESDDPSDDEEDPDDS